MSAVPKDFVSIRYIKKSSFLAVPFVVTVTEYIYRNIA